MPTRRRTGNVAGQPATAGVLVTYQGPTDPKDNTTAVIVPLSDPRRDETFPLGHPVETSQSTADRLAAMAGHTFHIEPATPEGGN